MQIMDDYYEWFQTFGIKHACNMKFVKCVVMVPRIHTEVTMIAEFYKHKYWGTRSQIKFSNDHYSQDIQDKKFTKQLLDQQCQMKAESGQKDWWQKVLA
jgi:hypothetical protein